MRSVFIFCLVSIASYAQDFNIKRFSVKDGFTNLPVGILFEDRLGYLWIGTHGDGLMRFDGRTFRNYSTADGLPSNFITGIVQDSKDVLWIGTKAGITKFNGKNFSSPIASGAGAFTKAQTSQLIQINDSIFFVSQDGGLGKIYNDSVYFLSKKIASNDSKIDRLLADKNGNLIFHSSAGTILSDHHDEISNLPFTRVYKTINFGDETLLSTNSGLFKIRDGKLEHVFPEIKDRTAIFDPMDSSFWVAPYTGLMKVKISNGRTLSPVVINSVNRITVAAQDREGIIWFGTFENGLLKVNRNDFVKLFPTSQLNNKPIRGIFKSLGGKLWVGTFGGGYFTIGADGKVKRHNDNDVAKNFITDIAGDDHGKIFIGTLGGLFIFDEAVEKGQWLNKSDGLATDSITSLEISETGDLLAGGYSNKLMRISAGNEIHNESLRGFSTMYSLKAWRKDSLFIVGDGKLFFKTPDQFEEIYHEGLKHTVIGSCSLANDTTLLLTTFGRGIFFRDLKGGCTHNLTIKDGLLSNLVFYAELDEEGNIWLGTDKGINRLRVDDKFNLIEISAFDDQNGFEGVKAKENSILLRSELKVVGSVDGIYLFKPQLNRPTVNNTLHLTDVKLRYGDIDPTPYAAISTRAFQLPIDPHFPYTINHLTFSFAKINKASPAQVKYRYKLEGFDNQWSEASEANSVTYTNLPPGEFKFLVSALSNHGGWGSSEIDYKFVIETPYFMQAWFLGLLLILAAGLVVLIFYWRLKQRVKVALDLERIRADEQNKIRKEIAIDYHDELGNKLAKMVNYVNTIRYINKMDVEILNKIEETSKSLHRGTKDFIWAIDPGNDEITHLFLYIRDFGDKMFCDNSIAFRAFNRLNREVQLPHGLGREVILIFKEAITNAYRHSHAKNITFELDRDKDGNFLFTLCDDGISLLAQPKDAPGGLSNMRQRAKKIGAKLLIDNGKLGGVTVKLLLHINHHYESCKKKNLSY